MKSPFKRVAYRYTRTPIEISGDKEMYEVTSKNELYILSDKKRVLRGMDAQFYAATWKQTGDKIKYWVLYSEIIKALANYMG